MHAKYLRCLLLHEDEKRQNQGSLRLRDVRQNELSTASGLDADIYELDTEYDFHG
jgi:hypothetical protein